jgi:type VI secretion system Hcp family effector
MKDIRVRPPRNLAAAFSIAVALAMPTAAMADLIALNLSNNIHGDITVDGYKDWIEVLSLSGNVQRTTKGGTPIFNDLVIHKRFDRSSPPLFLSMVTGKPLGRGEITFLRQDRFGKYTDKYLNITLSDIVLTKFETDGSETGGDLEQINLNYSRIQLTAWPMQGGLPGGPITACYDVMAARAC